MNVNHDEANQDIGMSYKNPSILTDTFAFICSSALDPFVLNLYYFLEILE